MAGYVERREQRITDVAVLLRDYGIWPPDDHALRELATELVDTAFYGRKSDARGEAAAEAPGTPGTGGEQQGQDPAVPGAGRQAPEPDPDATAGLDESQEVGRTVFGIPAGSAYIGPVDP